eukprot:5147987-Lingulodinium_polyedra.AAC.1
MRPALEEQRLVAVCTLKACGYTYFGVNSASVINSVFMTARWAGRVKQCCPATRSCSRLQAIPDRRPRDHVAIYVEVEYALQYQGGAGCRRWDFVGMAQALYSEQDE